MIRTSAEQSSPDLEGTLLVSVGNTRTRLAVVEHGAPGRGASVENERVVSGSADGIAPAFRDDGLSALVVTTAPEPADAIERALRAVADDRGVGARILRFARDLPIPLTHSLVDPSTLGADRAMNALGAFARSEEACVVVDAGTAITVDFVDGAGVFHGGAIAPGIRMMLAALASGTANLPALEFDASQLPKSGDEPFGKSTAQAMQVGVAEMARGVVARLLDRYAEFYEAYPRVVATGGDAHALFDDDPLVEAIDPDLTLAGMLRAWRLVAEQEDGQDTDERS